MTDLRDRLLDAERAGAMGVSGAGVGAALVPAVRRRKTFRAAAVSAVVVAVAIVFAAAGVSFLKNSHVVEPAVAPVVEDAPQVTSAALESTPGETPTEQMWSEIDDSWVLTLWAPHAFAGTGAVQSLHFVVVAPDGRTWDLRSQPLNTDAQLLSWDPVARTALISTSPALSAPVSEDAQLGIIRLDGGEDSWVSECLDSERIAGDTAAQVAAAHDGGYVVRNGCGAEFLMRANGVRTSLDAAGEAALAEAEYPRTGITEIVETPEGAEVHTADGARGFGFDPATCSVLVRARAMAIGQDGLSVGCAVDQGFTLTQEQLGEVTLTRMPGFAGSPFITKLCGTSSVYGSLSDASYGVGVVEGRYAKPLMLGGSQATDCVDGRLTWYLAGGDLFIAPSDDAIVRVVDLTGGSQSEPSAGVVAVVPAPAP